MKLLNNCLFILFTVYSISNTSFASEKSIKEYDFKNFNSIEINGPFIGEIIQSDEFKVEIEYDESIEENLIVNQNGKVVRIGLKGRNSNIKSRPKITIHLPKLSHLEISGACELKLIKIECDQLNIEMSGASSLFGNVKVDNFGIELSGASMIGLMGNTNELELYLSGASEFKGKSFLISGKLLLDFSGASSALCRVDGDIVVKMSGASSLTYIGKPTFLKKELTGASSISEL